MNCLKELNFSRSVAALCAVSAQSGVLVGQHTCHNFTVLPLAQLMTQHPLLGHDISFDVWIWMCEIS